MTKKILVILFIILAFDLSPALAINVGSCKTESEYGLLDGFQFNWNRKDKSEPLVEVREESTKAQREKERKEIQENEYQNTRYMFDGKAMI